MTTLLIQTEQIPLTVSFPALVQMTDEQFYECCHANRDLRIARSATGEVIIMPPAFSGTGNRNNAMCDFPKTPAKTALQPLSRRRGVGGEGKLVAHRVKYGN